MIVVSAIAADLVSGIVHWTADTWGSEMMPVVGRRFLRPLSFLFGFGVGLVVDEFALFWNLNPDYYQASSRLVAALVVFALAQIVYFRALYATVWRRLVARSLASAKSST